MAFQVAHLDWLDDQAKRIRRHGGPFLRRGELLTLILEELQRGGLDVSASSSVEEVSTKVRRFIGR